MVMTSCAQRQGVYSVLMDCQLDRKMIARSDTYITKCVCILHIYIYIYIYTHIYQNDTLVCDNLNNTFSKLPCRSKGVFTLLARSPSYDHFHLRQVKYMVGQTYTQYKFKHPRNCIRIGYAPPQMPYMGFTQNIMHSTTNS